LLRESTKDSLGETKPKVKKPCSKTVASVANVKNAVCGTSLGTAVGAGATRKDMDSRLPVTLLSGKPSNALYMYARAPLLKA
jgi:hypothetical protein